MGQCARCALRDDLTALMLNDAADPFGHGTPSLMSFAAVDRPESILTWKRSAKVQALLTGLASGEIPLTHDGLDALGRGRHITHLRSLLEHNGLLPHRDEHLARFEAWLAAKLDAPPNTPCEPQSSSSPPGITCADCAETPRPGQASDGPIRSAKQEITETLKFLTWLHETHHRTAATCTQQDVDEYLADWPDYPASDPHLLRLGQEKQDQHGGADRSPTSQEPHASLTQEQRLAWLKELLTGDAESLPYRVAGTLLLLYAQPLVRVAALPTSAVVLTRRETRISLGVEPVPVPRTLRRHAHSPSE